MLVAISGSQGSGKSTILQKLEDLGHPVIKRKTSRSLLYEWKMTLNQVLQDPELIIQFQEELIERKRADEQDAFRDNNARRRLQEPTRVWFTERTYADAFVYALIYLGKNNEHSEWINEYYDKCMRYSQSYDYVFYLKAGHFKIEHDGVRGSNRHYSRMVDTAMLDVTQQMIMPSLLSVIETPDLEQRIQTILYHSGKIQSSVY